jgi:hypothetical protein
MMCGICLVPASLPTAKAADIEVSLTAEQKKPMTGFWVGALGGFGLGQRYAAGHWTKKGTVFAVLDGVLIGGMAGLSAISGSQASLARAFTIGLGFAFLVERAKQGYEAKRDVETFNGAIQHHIETPRNPDMGKVFSFEVLALQF